MLFFRKDQKGLFMKKLFSLITAVILVFAFGTAAFAEEGAGIKIESAADGDKSTVSVVISGKTNPEMIQFCINYDPEKMECTATAAGVILEGNSKPLINVKDGKIFFVWDSLDAIEEDGVLLQVEFKSLDSSEDAEVSIESGKNLIVAGSDFKNVAPEKIESVTVFKGTKPSQGVVINPSGGSSSKTEEESSAPDIIEPEKEDKPKEEKPAEESKPQEEKVPEENKEPEELPAETPQSGESPESEEQPEENKVPAQQEIEVITNNHKEKSGAPIWLIILPIGAAVAGAALILIKRKK